MSNAIHSLFMNDMKMSSRNYDSNDAGGRMLHRKLVGGVFTVAGSLHLKLLGIHRMQQLCDEIYS